MSVMDVMIFIGFCSEETSLKFEKRSGFHFDGLIRGPVEQTSISIAGSPSIHCVEAM